MTLFDVVSWIAIGVGLAMAVILTSSLVAEVRRQRRARVYAPIQCECGNGPLDEEDIVNDGRCRCCRIEHLFYHDDESCRRCGAPRPRSRQPRS